MGNLYSEKKEFSRSEAAYLEALEIYKRFTQNKLENYERNMAWTQNDLGYLYFKFNQLSKAEMLLTASFILYEKCMEGFLQSHPRTALNLLDVYITIQDSAKTLLEKAVLPTEWGKVNNKLYNIAKRNKKVAIKYSEYYGNYSWYALFALKFKEAEGAAAKAYEVDTTQVWIKTNLAHALLFQNRYAKALQVYTELKPLKNGEGKSYAVICLEGLDALENSGIIHRDVTKVRAFLKK